MKGYFFAWVSYVSIVMAMVKEKEIFDAFNRS
jgi:hypothetical protein